MEIKRLHNTPHGPAQTKQQVTLQNSNLTQQANKFQKISVMTAVLGVNPSRKFCILANTLSTRSWSPSFNSSLHFCTNTMPERIITSGCKGNHFSIAILFRDFHIEPKPPLQRQRGRVCMVFLVYWMTIPLASHAKR
jgi:hypothetical protein